MNRKDRSGNNVFEGGFLGLDNIGVFYRNGLAYRRRDLEHAYGTAWMVFFGQYMLRISLEIAQKFPAFEEFVGKFFEHFIWIAGSDGPHGADNDQMWDEEDGFFYDALRLPDGKAMRLSLPMVGLLPLAAVAIFEEGTKLPTARKNILDFMERHPELSANLHMPSTPGLAGRRPPSLDGERGQAAPHPGENAR